MSDTFMPRRLAELLLASRRNGVAITAIDPALIPTDAAEADSVQLAVADTLGPVGGYKVLQVADKPGSWGAIQRAEIYTAPASAGPVAGALKIEAEVAFRFASALPGRSDGRPYDMADILEALDGAFVAFELLQTRLALPAPAPAFIGRADAMGNWGLVTGPLVRDWRAIVHADIGVRLDVGGKTMVDRRGGHPSGDPAHPLPWLANALVAAGRPIAAGDVVTTGAFGGGHPIVAGQTAVATIEGLGSITFTLC